jgi:DNA modification methylase
MMNHPNGLRALAYFDTLFPEEDDRVESCGSESIVDQVKSFKGFGESTQAVNEGDVPYFINEFWTSGQRKAHSIHEVSYRACFKPQLPAFFIKRLTEAGDVVLDPFMGRGTTPVEAGLHGRKAFGNDINPLSVLLTRPRLSMQSYREIQKALMEIDWTISIDSPAELLAFYHPETLRRICVLREHLLRHAPLEDEEPCPALDWIRMVAINRLTGHSPGFFSVYSLPPNQAVSVESQRRINEKRNQVPPMRDLVSIILKKTRTLLRDGGPRRVERCLSIGAADDLRSIPDGTVSLTVTSPPFLDIVQYADDNWLRCWFAGIDSTRVSISMHRTEAAWEAMVRSVLKEQARVLKPGGHVAFEVGEVRNGKVLLEKLVWSAAEGLPFERLGVMVNQQEFTKTANCWGVGNNAKGTNTNRIVLLRRDGGRRSE